MLRVNPPARAERRVVPAGESRADRLFLAGAAALFLASAALTIRGSVAMAGIGETPVAGGVSIAAHWTPLCGGSWPAAAAGFLGMWLAMTAAMMLPSLTPALCSVRRALRGTQQPCLNRLTAVVAAGYFLVWAAVGAAAFAAGAAVALAAVAQPAIGHGLPLAAAAVVLAAGAVQVSGWKARHLLQCRQAAGTGAPPASPAAALRHGFRLGRHCSASCSGLTAALLSLGMMDLPMMAAATAAITLERLAPAGARIAQCTGAVLIGLGSLLIAEAVAPL